MGAATSFGRRPSKRQSRLPARKGFFDKLTLDVATATFRAPAPGFLERRYARVCMRLALFDLDDTLIDGDSDVEWSQLLGTFGVMDPSRTRTFHLEYARGTLDIDAFLRHLLEPLAREPLERLLSWRREYLVERIRPRIRPAARELVNDHARAGHDVVLITATHRFLVDPIAEELSIHHVIASEAEVVGGRFTGRVAGTPCFREGKIERLNAWLAGRGLEFGDVSESWFYSDSHNDVPLLSLVTHPMCVNPDSKLAAHAQRLGWPVLDLRAGPHRDEPDRNWPRQIETEYSSPPIG